MELSGWSLIGMERPQISFAFGSDFKACVCQVCWYHRLEWECPARAIPGLQPLSSHKREGHGHDSWSPIHDFLILCFRLFTIWHSLFLCISFCHFCFVLTKWAWLHCSKKELREVGFVHAWGVRTCKMLGVSQKYG